MSDLDCFKCEECNPYNKCDSPYYESDFNIEYNLDNKSVKLYDACGKSVEIPLSPEKLKSNLRLSLEKETIGRVRKGEEVKFNVKVTNASKVFDTVTIQPIFSNYFILENIEPFKLVVNVAPETTQVIKLVGRFTEAGTHKSFITVTGKYIEEITEANTSMITHQVIE